jgi:hypothetical protein
MAGFCVRDIRGDVKKTTWLAPMPAIAGRAQSVEYKSSATQCIEKALNLHAFLLWGQEAPADRA